MAGMSFLKSFVSSSDEEVDENTFSGANLQRDFMHKVMQENISEGVLENLPEEMDDFYSKRHYNEHKIQERRMRDRKELQAKIVRRLHMIKERLELGIELSPWELQLWEEKGHKVTAIESTDVEIDATEILDGVVKGDYSIQELHAAREGTEEAAAKDPVENSPLQLLDNILDDSMERTKEVLKTKEPGQFFESYGFGANDIIEPEQMKNAIDHASTAVKLALGNPIVTNDAKEACDSFILATSMNEAEMKMKERQEIAIKAQARHEATTNLAEAAAASLALSTDTELKTSQTDIQDRTLGFNITDLNYDISFLPSNDPDVYKPLEIISYIGMTKNES